MRVAAAGGAGEGDGVDEKLLAPPPFLKTLTTLALAALVFASAAGAQGVGETMTGMSLLPGSLVDWLGSLVMIAVGVGMVRSSSNSGDAPRQLEGDLTDLDREIADWRARGWSNQAIARRRNVTEKAVKLHVQKVRHRHVGRIGLATLHYNRVNGKYFEPDKTTDAADYKKKASGE